MLSWIFSRCIFGETRSPPKRKGPSLPPHFLQIAAFLPFIILTLFVKLAHERWIAFVPTSTTGIQFLPFLCPLSFRDTTPANGTYPIDQPPEIPDPLRAMHIRTSVLVRFHGQKIGNSIPFRRGRGPGATPRRPHRVGVGVWEPWQPTVRPTSDLCLCKPARSRRRGRGQVLQRWREKDCTG